MFWRNLSKACNILWNSNFESWYFDKLFKKIWPFGPFFKALHSEHLTELLGRFPSRNKYFVISEVRVERHFFVIFGKFGISKFPKFPKFPNIWKNQFPKFPNFFRNFRTFSELFSKPFRTFWPKNRVFCPKTSNFTSFFWNFRNLRTFSNNYRTFYRT